MRFYCLGVLFACSLKIRKAQPKIKQKTNRPKPIRKPVPSVTYQKMALYKRKKNKAKMRYPRTLITMEFLFSFELQNFLAWESEQLCA